MSSIKIGVGMSGGIDSSVAVALLREMGYQVTGLTMKIFSGNFGSGQSKYHGCYGPGEKEEIEDARKVAVLLDIEHCIIDLVTEYEKEVLNNFVQGYKTGQTPNPCIKCNSIIKFGIMREKAESAGMKFDFIATGHYARVEYSKESHRYLLKQARDLKKDQSYFLAFLSQKQLASALFPIGDYYKDEVREIGRSLGLGIECKKESQDFMDGGYAGFIGPCLPGRIISTTDDVLGNHRGIHFYTVGQRKGLGISAKNALYVVEIKPDRNEVIVGRWDELFSGGLIASQLNWIAFDRIQKSIKAEAKIRNTQEKVGVLITPLDEYTVQVEFEMPQHAIAPGQAIVFYDGDIVLGGGIIEKAVSQ